MFFHLADKIYAVNKMSQTECPNGLLQAEYDKYPQERGEFPTFSHLAKDLVRRFVRDRKVTLLVMPEKDFAELLLDWCHYLKLSEEAFNTVVQHSDFCEQYVEDADKDISRPSGFTVEWKDEGMGNSRVRFPEIYPAELCINMIGKEKWATEKYEYFRMYDLYARIKDTQFGLYLMGVKGDYTIKNNDQDIKILYKSKDFIDYAGRYVDTSFLDMPLKDYIRTCPTLGYNRFNIWKFNWLLANHVRNTSYEY